MWLNVSHVSALVVLGFLATGCGDPAPTCAPRSDTFRFCSENTVYECPNGPDEAVMENLAIDEGCGNDVQCLLDADYVMVEATKKTECTGTKNKCVETTMTTIKSASCEE